MEKINPDNKYLMIQKLCPFSLNNKAIAFLQTGRECAAMECFELGLATLRDQFLASDGNLSAGLTSKDIPRPFRDIDEDDLSYDQRIWVRGVAVPAPRCVNHEPGVVVMYDRALFVQCHHFHAKPEVLSAIILFNMGLMHHIRGSHGVTKFLEDAYHLYQISLCILDRNDAFDVDPLLYLALRNNMAHISSSLSMAEKMLEELCALQDTIASECDYVDEEDLQIFYVNVLCGLSAIPTVAPAA
jgi:hypothetical protein